ncbi:hypothetical protein BT246_63130 (plasmid) [Bacillus thuringiensis]|uniref:Uncharacterized protein n=1 Tax=Bacillus thuringiensis TaxID=1428 RepID=A0A9W3SHS6_BACTU|nr:hypothetical protein BT246_63130 [Bacillus thuringiensis]
MYKKITKMAPIMALSTAVLLSPGSTFAAEKAVVTKSNVSSLTTNTVMQSGSIIQGYLIKNGVKTPVYNSEVQTRSTAVNEAPYPELSSNPNDPVPSKGSITSESGNVGSVLYFSKFNSQKLQNTAEPVYWKNVYLEKTPDGNIIFGTYDPTTLKRTPNLVNIMMTPSKVQYYQSFFTDTKIKRETAYEKIGGGTPQPKNTSYTFSSAVTSGLSTSDAIGGSLTLGYKYSVKEGGGVLPVEATQEFSLQLTASYNHTITVSSQTTNTQTYSVAHAGDSYKNDKYVAAMYQLKSHYTVIPGPALTQSGSILAQEAFQYDDSSLYLAVTPGAGI